MSRKRHELLGISVGKGRGSEILLVREKSHGVLSILKSNAVLAVACDRITQESDITALLFNRNNSHF